MTQPTLEECKAYWRWVYAVACLTKVKSSIEHINQNPISNADVEFILFAGIITTYSKPFIKCHGVGCLDQKIVPKKLQKSHEVVLDFRNKTVAHIDAINFRADDPSFGNINRVVINIEKENYGYTASLIDAYKTLKDQIHELCCKIIQKADYHTSRFEKKYIAKSGLKRGNYLLNIDSQDKRPFIPLNTNSSPATISAPA